MKFHWSESVETKFQERLKQQSFQGYQIATLLGLTLFPILTCLDWFTQRAHFWPLFQFRIATTLFFLVAYWKGRSKYIVRSPDWAIVMIFTVAALASAGMVFLTGGYESPYYAGFGLIILAATIVVPWAPKKNAALTIWLCFIYMASVLAQASFQIERNEIFLNNMIFLFSTAAIGTAGAFLSDRLRREWFGQYTAAEEARDSIEQSVRILSLELGEESGDVVSLSREIADRKTQLQSSIRYAELAKDEAVNALQIRDEFISIASHELKTPITTISLQNQFFKKLLAKSALPPEKIEQYNKAVDCSESQVKRITRLIDDMLDLSRIQANHLKFEMADECLDTLIRELLERFNSRFLASGIQVSSEIQENLKARFDIIRMEQVFTNLFENALKYAPKSPLIVKAFRDGPHIRFEVKDHGPGVAEDHLEKIFDRFERASVSINVGGLGLGLYIVKKIMQGHRGRIWVEGALGRGTTFIGLIPSAE